MDSQSLSSSSLNIFVAGAGRRNGTVEEDEGKKGIDLVFWLISKSGVFVEGVVWGEPKILLLLLNKFLRPNDDFISLSPPNIKPFVLTWKGVELEDVGVNIESPSLSVFTRLPVGVDALLWDICLLRI